ncbi:unnamed protein product, partial [marine sediment metagenome]
GVHGPFGGINKWMFLNIPYFKIIIENIKSHSQQD